MENTLSIRQQYQLALRLIRLRVCIDEMSELGVSRRYKSFGIERPALDAALDSTFLSCNEFRGWRNWSRQMDFNDSYRLYRLSVRHTGDQQEDACPCVGADFINTESMEKEN